MRSSKTSSKPTRWVRSLSCWFERVARPLPWRLTQDPYAIWISEVMLQQTQVAAVTPFYRRFMQRFPTLQDLAKADEQEVLRYWSGLGYYSRARNLRRGAIHILEVLGGTFPQERESVLRIPGIGPYTAGAVLSIAFNLPEAVVDGNVQRVFARFFELDHLLETKEARTFFWKKAQHWVEKAVSPRVFNQALMELGATICTKATPSCNLCPIASGCESRQKGNQGDFPKRRPRRKVQRLWWGSLIQEHRGKIFLNRNSESEWWAGLWDFPRVEANSREEIEPMVEKLVQGSFTVEESLSIQEHTVTHHRIHVSPFVLRLKVGAVGKNGRDGKWVTLTEAQHLPLSSLARKILHTYLGERKDRK